MSAVTDRRAVAGEQHERRPFAAGWRVHPVQILIALVLIAYPTFANDFFLAQVGGQSLLLGMIALSLTWLAGYGGMVSLAQMTVAGCAGYMLALFGHNNVGMGFDWPWWAAMPIALVIAVAFGTVTGALAVRTRGIYTIMITLAISVAFFYLTRQNYTIFNGYNGFNGVLPPHLFGVDWRAPVPFYYLCLALAAIAYFVVLYIARSPFGLALQGIRDNPRRMQAVGYNVAAHRIAAYAVSAVIAAFGGLLLVWFNGRISPGTIAVSPVIDILVIAVIGGLRHPVGPFVGALIFVLLDNFAIELIAPERFNLVIGSVFLAIVLFSPDGMVGIWAKLRNRLSAQERSSG